MNQKISNMIELSQLNEVFARYGYEQKDVSEGQYVIFSSGTSVYPAVEIVQLRGASIQQIQNVKSEYSEAGYAVRICNLDSIEEIERYLFNLFFKVEESIRRYQDRYEEYTMSIMKTYQYQTSGPIKDYQYINIPYLVEYDFKKPEITSGKDLISSIRDDLKKEGAQLIIVEAGAGFGKTSTAYELLNTYKDIKKDTLPLFMELYNDRIATTFRYLLLSQIDRTFKVRQGSDIVLYNIKRGNIHLIIDGFDELLSKDLDNGQLDTRFDKVETMLSTIGELLTDKAKVILTTRKTAIFAGESFYDWHQSQITQGRNFRVSRYQLDSPSIEDWLDKKRIAKLPDNFVKISNPVLLGYLRYLNDYDFAKVVESTSLTKYYFSSILKREKERQDLPFNVNEQWKILSHLASYFAGFDASAFCRSDIKDAILEFDGKLIEDNSSPRQDVKSLSNALTNHAFLDRKGDNNIGFINDFVFGTFFMHAIIYENGSFYEDFFKSASFSFIDKAILAGSVSDEDTKLLLWNSLWNRCTWNPVLGFWADMLLRNEICHDYSNISLDGKTLTFVIIGSPNYSIKKCSFSNMTFKDCFFDFNYISECTFINCTFYNCDKEGSNLCCSFYGCSDQSESFIDHVEIGYEITDNEDDSVESLDFQILDLYFKVDHRSPRMRMISKIKDNFDNDKSFKKTFDYLVSNGYILTNGDKSFISQSGIDYFNQKKQ